LLGRNFHVVAGIALVLLTAPVALATVGGDPSTVATGSQDGLRLGVTPGFATALKAATPPPARSDTLAWPVHGAVTGQFHEARAGHIHQGIDIPMPLGTPIRAAGAGRVVLRQPTEGYGNYTCIAHVHILTCYGHQSRFATKLGAHVRRGEVIGYVGHSGNAPVDHLHFEVRRGTRPWGTPVNPLHFLPRG
jgi:murein DD-endopeptidase MepM/ murein hydrolase activator NlpD